MLLNYESLCALGVKMNPHSEEVWLVSLNSQLEPISEDLIFRGTVDFCLFHPRDLFRVAVTNNASSIVLAHNHLSTNCFPSKADYETTKRLWHLANMMEIPLLDHLIFSTRELFSFSQSGLMRTWRKRRRI